MNTPPGSPDTGDRYIVGSSPSGAWSGNPNDLAEWDGSQWLFLAPQIGWPVYVTDEQVLYYWNGTTWTKLRASPGGSDTQVQFNDGGDFGGSSGLTYNKTTTALQVDNLKLDGNTLSSTNANGVIVIGPNGNGAIQVDTAGNTRGTYAVDLQRQRSAADQVAAGSSSLVVGGWNKNTASYSTQSGTSNIQAGAHNSQTGYGNDQSGFRDTQSGYYNTQSGNYSEQGGYLNTQSGYYCTQSGYYNTQNDRGCIQGGIGNTQSGICGVQGGGINSQTGDYGLQSGFGANDYGRYAAITHAAGSFPSGGRAQISTMVARNATAAGTTPAILYLNGSSIRPTVSTDVMWLFTASIIAVEQGMANGKKFVRQGIIVNDGGTTSISSLDTIGTDLTIGSPGAWTISITADDTNDALQIQVTGAAGDAVRWVAKLEIVEVSYPT
ncbi:MAG: DUF2793 domain-containing protein [Phycisphaeraceae bacterium]|nr:DUF2793 domain-containing protein [Phycisphaeraceae bacterium]